MSRLGLIWMFLLIAYILILEIKLLKSHCVNCYYYGKYCAFGKGKLSALFFKKGSPKEFNRCKINWKDILPDFLVSIIPLIVGIVLLIRNFDWVLLILMIALLLLTSAGNSFVRGSLACKYCKQRKLGCPAEQLFNKKKNKR
jgi:hypothetical protein